MVMMIVSERLLGSSLPSLRVPDGMEGIESERRDNERRSPKGTRKGTEGDGNGMRRIMR